MRPSLPKAAAIAAILFSASAPADEIPTTVLTRQRSVEVSPPGPWGTLEFYQIPLSLPPEHIPLLRIPSQQTVWRLPLNSSDELRAAFLGAGLTETETDAALAGARVLADAAMARVFPADDAIYRLSPETREKVYSLLAAQSENPSHARPIYLNSRNLSLWFEGSGIPISAVEDVAQLAYPTPSGRGYFFADLPFTLRNAQSTDEERRIMQAMMRRPALVVRLQLSTDSPIEQMRDYWSSGFRNKAVRPLLESSIASVGTGKIDIAHLLPATPRQYLNRFPGPADGIGGRYPDWFWTCYNFFSFNPRDVYADSPERDAILIREFERAAPPLQFGDMLVLESGSRFVHGCVHIADDIVFTKNGPDIFSPWILMKLDDVVAFHDLGGDVSLSVYRRREAPVQGVWR